MNVVLLNEPSKAAEVVSGTAEHVYYRGSLYYQPKQCTKNRGIPSKSPYICIV